MAAVRDRRAEHFRDRRAELFSVVDFATIWKPVALVFVGVGMLVGVGGSLTAIRKFLQV